MINLDNPDHYALALKILYGDPEKLKRQVEESEEYKAIVQDCLIRMVVDRDNPDSFAAYYWLIHGRRCPDHCLDWVSDIFFSRVNRYEGTVLWSWRGSWKSTTLSETYMSYRIGKQPELTHLLVCANDDSAEKITSAVAMIIENHAWWKILFPHVVPWKAKQWSLDGFCVIDNRYTQEEWVTQTGHTIDPTFVGGGYKSSRLIGKHPSGGLWIDDIHDEKNSSSPKEKEMVVKIVTDTLFPMTVKDPDRKGGRRVLTEIITVGTPWSAGDAYHYMIETGVFYHTSMPVMVAAEEGDEGAVWIEGRNRDGILFPDIQGWWILTWPEVFDVETIVTERAKSGLRGFWRMYMLDLEKGGLQGLKYYTYPHQEIDLVSWPKVGGCDPATIMEQGVPDPGRTLFSHAYGAITPREQLVIFDGILEQCTQAQAEEHLKKPQSLWDKTWRKTVMEGDGLGETLYVSMLLRNPSLRLEMMKTKGRSKRYRQEMEMGPWLENGMVLISDADTPYLNALRKALDEFPDGNNDIRDGAYWVCRAAPQCLKAPSKAEEEEAKEFSRKQVALEYDKDYMKVIGKRGSKKSVWRIARK